MSAPTPSPFEPLELSLHGADQIELLVADLSVARALYEGVPCARLLARTQLARDMLDLLTWDALVGRLAGGPTQLEKVRRGLARHLRAAIADGPLPASDATVAILVYAVCATDRGDASLAEAFAGDGVPSEVASFACTLHEPRLAHHGAPLKLATFEAAIRLASVGVSGPWLHRRVVDTMTQLAEMASIPPEPPAPRRWSGGRDLYEGLEAPIAGRKMAYIERADLDTLVRRDPRELASIIARLERDRGPAQLDKFLADLSELLKKPGALVLAVAPPDPEGATIVPSEPASAAAPPSDPPAGEARRPSTVPLDWSRPEIGAEVADAFERSHADLARVRHLVARGGEPALDAIGAEMLRVPSHPAASAAFAEILARSGRQRDVVRLVTYFAVAPDPPLAARALSACTSPELPEVLRAWLEAMLPSDGGDVPQGDDPSTSSAARLAACVASLAPYPHLYQAVRPLLVRVTDRPPARI